MKFPLNASQTIATVAIAGGLLGGAFALGKMKSSSAESAPPAAAPTTVADSGKAAAPKPAAVAAAKAELCKGCWRVVDLHTEERTTKTSGVGVVGGAVIGGLLGSQVGGGNGKKLATVGGAVAGGYAGNEIEKRRNTHKVWVVKLEDAQGHPRSHEQAANPNLQAGDVVELREGQLLRR